MTFDEKYPGEYLEHFLAMFNNDLNEEEIKKHINLANAIEGIDYVKSLKTEIELIIENEDDLYFISKMNKDGYESFDKNWINFILKSASEFIEGEKS